MSDLTYADFDLDELTRQLDKAKTHLFTHKCAGFFGSLLCSMNFIWTLDEPTACVDGVNICWNPHHFSKRVPAARVTILMHELLHPAELHFMRQGSRIGEVWNYATDISINNRLRAEGYSFEGIENCWMDPRFPLDMPPEDIYDQLMDEANGAPVLPSLGSWGNEILRGSNNAHGGDMLPECLRPPTKEEQAQAVANVVRAVQQAKLTGGQVPGQIETILTQFLAPVVPWEVYLHRFFTELIEGGITWSRPNRRYPEVYMPSSFLDEGALAHVAYFEDVSGSIGDADVVRFNSEFKFVKETYNPKRMTLIQFDMIIQQVLEYTEEDEFNQVPIKGRGGTSLSCVREWIIEHRPTAVVIFSDMECEMMQPLDFDVPILWVVIRNRGVKVHQGQVIYMK